MHTNIEKLIITCLFAYHSRVKIQDVQNDYDLITNNNMFVVNNARISNLNTIPKETQSFIFAFYNYPLRFFWVKRT